MTPALEKAMQQHPEARLFVPVDGGYLPFRDQAEFERWDQQQGWRTCES